MKLKNLMMLVCTGLAVQTVNCMDYRQQAVERAVAQQQISLLVNYYQAWNAEVWFQELPEFCVLKAVGGLLFNGSVSYTTARALLFIDQSTASYPYVFPADPDLEVLENAFLYVRDHNLKLLQNFIVRKMFALGV